MMLLRLTRRAASIRASRQKDQPAARSAMPQRHAVLRAVRRRFTTAAFRHFFFFFFFAMLCRQPPFHAAHFDYYAIFAFITIYCAFNLAADATPRRARRDDATV